MLFQLNRMTSKMFSTNLLRLVSTTRYYRLNKRPILCFNCRTNFEYHSKCHQILILSQRNFSDKNEQKINKIVTNSDRLTQEATEQEKRPYIVAQRLSKEKEFFYVVVQKPYELINWVKKTPREKKKNLFFSGIIKSLKALGVVSIIWMAYWFSANGENPLTGRKCVYSVPIEMSTEIETDIFKEIFNKYMESGMFLPSTHEAVKRLDRCVDRLVESNADLDLIGDGIWTPVVINDDKICDVVILKDSRNIFVYKKLLDLCETDDELAYVLCHELSHLMMDHNREPITYIPIYYMPLVMLLPRLWSISRDPFFHWVDKIDTFLENEMKKLIRKLITFNPYSEKIEEEADRIAMQLMTRCCYDVRKCRHFCRKHRHLSQTKDNNNENQSDVINHDFFAKHPITDNKLLYLFQYIKPFMELRKRCNCQPLV